MIDPVKFLSQELSNDDQAVRVNSIYRLRIIIALIDNDRI